MIFYQKRAKLIATLKRKVFSKWWMIIQFDVIFVSMNNQIQKFETVTALMNVHLAIKLSKWRKWKQLLEITLA